MLKKTGIIDIGFTYKLLTSILCCKLWYNTYLINGLVTIIVIYNIIHILTAIYYIQILAYFVLLLNKDQ